MSSSCIYQVLENIFLLLESDHGPGYSNVHRICQQVESHPAESRLVRLTSNERGEHISSLLAFAMQAEIRVEIGVGQNWPHGICFPRFQPATSRFLTASQSCCNFNTTRSEKGCLTRAAPALLPLEHFAEHCAP